VTDSSNSEADERQKRWDVGLPLFYAHLNTEIATLREAEFRTGLMALALDAAIIATLTQDPVAAALTSRVRWIISVSSCAIVVVLMLYLFQLHHYLTQHRFMRKKIERYYRLDAWNVIDGAPLFPPTWRRDATVSFSFQAWGIVIPLTLLMLLVQGATLYLVWKV
jgi:hypothetical protein